MLEDENGLLTTVGTVLTFPFAREEKDRAVTLVSFSLAHFSGRPEVQIKDEIYASLAKHDVADKWSEKWGSDTADFTQSEGGLVIRTGKVDCTP